MTRWPIEDAPTHAPAQRCSQLERRQRRVPARRSPLSAINRRVRASTVSALRSCARSRRRSAYSGASLICTSRSPCFTRCPEVNAIRMTRPAASEASSTCRAAPSSPTSRNVRGTRARSTDANATLVADQPPAPSEPDEQANKPITLASVRPRKEAPGRYPLGSKFTEAQWRELSTRWRANLDERITKLTRLRDELDSCIGCGCLSLEEFPLRNPQDALGAEGPGPRPQLFPAARCEAPSLGPART